MSNDKEPRHRFLRQVLAIVPAATVVPGAALTQSMQSTSDAPPAASVSAKAYAPSYFTDAEWSFIQAAVDRLIPADDHGPGALAANVHEFIDHQMETPYGHGKLWSVSSGSATRNGLSDEPRAARHHIYRHGIKSCDDHCIKQYGGKTFTQLDHKTQETVLGEMEHAKIEFDVVPARTFSFFSYLLGNVKEGFFADPIYGDNKDMVGWKMIGFPGARADFMDWIDQPGVKYPYGPVSIEGRQA